MTILTGWLYELRARRGFGPPLEIETSLEDDLRFLTDIGGPPAEVMQQWALDERLAPFLQPFPFEAALEQPLSGIPLLDRSRVQELVGGAKVGADSDLPAGRFWVFARVESGQFAMFAGDSAPALRLDVAMLVPAENAIQLRRLDPGFAIHEQTLEQESEPALVEEPCFHECTGVEPGAPYTGRCRNDGCGQGCTPVVFVRPADGIYRLDGCNC